MSQQGMPWRDNYGLICCLISTIARRYCSIYERLPLLCFIILCRNPQPLQNLKKEVAVAEDMLSNRELRTVEDLNLGDLATFMELTMPMELHKEFQWSDYPNLENLYRVVSKVPEFSEIHQPFLEFCQMYRTHRDTGQDRILFSSIKLPITQPLHSCWFPIFIVHHIQQVLLPPGERY